MVLEFIITITLQSLFLFLFFIFRKFQSNQKEGKTMNSKVIKSTIRGVLVGESSLVLTRTNKWYKEIFKCEPFDNGIASWVLKLIVET